MCCLLRRRASGQRGETYRCLYMWFRQKSLSFVSVILRRRHGPGGTRKVERTHLEFVVKRTVHLSHGSTSILWHCFRRRYYGSECPHLLLCLVTLPGIMESTLSRALGVSSGWADGGQRQSLVSSRRLQKKTRSLSWARSFGSV